MLIAYLFQVFHELARHLQTRRLIARDSISLDQDRNFYCVVDGTVQVFAHAGTTTRQNGSWEEEDMNGYQLINEVGSGGTLSSLFSILSLFTDEVKLSWQDDSAGLPASRSGNQATSPRSTRPGRTDSDVSQIDLDIVMNRGHSQSISSSGSTAHPPEIMSPHTDLLSPSRVDQRSRIATSDAHSLSDSTPRSQFHHGIVGRATEDSTLAVIPAEAFRRVTKKFPKATGHIVQGLFLSQHCMNRS